MKSSSDGDKWSNNEGITITTVNEVMSAGECMCVVYDLNIIF